MNAPDRRSPEPRIELPEERARRDRAAGLDEMVRVSEDAGIYDLPDDVMAERLSDEPGGDAR